MTDTDKTNPGRPVQIDGLFDSYFTHKIGAIVAHVTTLTVWTAEFAINGKRDRHYRGTAPTPMVVVERHLQQCHGGVQGFYLCRAAGSEGSLRLIEQEIVPYDEVMKIAEAMKPEPRKPNAWRDAVENMAAVGAASEVINAVMAEDDEGGG